MAKARFGISIVTIAPSGVRRRRKAAPADAPAPPRAKASAIDKRIGAVLEERRIARDRSPGEVARRLGVSRQQYKKYEGGTDRMSAAKLQLALETLAIPPADFFERVASVDLAAPRNADRLRQTRDLVKAFKSIGEREMRRQCLSLLRTLARQRGRAVSEEEKRK